VLWSDESMFELFPSRRMWVRRKNERCYPDCIVKHDYKYGGVWLLTGLKNLTWLKGLPHCSMICSATMPRTIKQDGERLYGNEYKMGYHVILLAALSIVYD